MEKIRVAIVGANYMTKMYHLPVLSSFEEIEIAGICDIVEERAKELAKEYNIKKCYTDYRKMLDELQPDAVWLIVPTTVIFDMVMDALERKIDLFIEKPAGLTTYQTKVMAAFAEQQKSVTGVAFQRRYHPTILGLCEKVTAIAPLNNVSVDFYKNSKSKTGFPPNFRGAIEMLRCESIHAVDLVRFLAGLSEVKSVKASIKNFDCSYDTAYFANVEFENGIVGCFKINWRTATRLFKVELHAPGASAYLDINRGGELWTAEGDQPAFVSERLKQLDGGLEDSLAQGFFGENRAFVDAIKSRKELHNNLRDAVKTMELIDNVYFSNGIKPADCLDF